MPGGTTCTPTATDNKGVSQDFFKGGGQLNIENMFMSKTRY